MSSISSSMVQLDLFFPLVSIFIMQWVKQTIIWQLTSKQSELFHPESRSPRESFRPDSLSPRVVSPSFINSASSLKNEIWKIPSFSRCLLVLLCLPHRRVPQCHIRRWIKFYATENVLKFEKKFCGGEKKIYSQLSWVKIFILRIFLFSEYFSFVAHWSNWYWWSRLSVIINKVSPFVVITDDHLCMLLLIRCHSSW
jgi:hypothetical protein